MEQLKKWAVPIVAGLLILYLIMRSKGGGGASQPRTSYLLQSSGGGDEGAVGQARDAMRIAGFQSLAQLAGEKLTAETEQKNREAELEGLRLTLTSGQEVERIRGGIERELGLQNLEGLTRQIEGQTEAYRIQSSDRRYDTDAQIRAIDATSRANESMFTLQARAALDTLLAQIGAVSTVGKQYRNKSLERQGTILTALASAFGQSHPYSYQSAFGGPRPPAFLQQLAGALNSAGRFFGGGYY